jgi:YidC/Oxa1 family membrane protein insertase
MQSFVEEISLNSNPLVFEGDKVATANSIVDVLYQIPSNAWDTLRQAFPTVSDSIYTLEGNMGHMNNFLGLNIADSPLSIIQDSFANGNYLLLIGALMIPILSAATQFLNIKLMPTTAPPPTDGEPSTMQTSMRTMNYMMPLMSLVFCFSFPIGMGIYWVAGSLIRSIQQFFINRHYDKIGMDSIIEKQKEKAKHKKKKKGFIENQITNAAQTNTKNISNRANAGNVDKGNVSLNKPVNHPVAQAGPAKGGSLMSKANMVRDYNERKNK